MPIARQSHLFVQTSKVRWPGGGGLTWPANIKVAALSVGALASCNQKLFLLFLDRSFYRCADSSLSESSSCRFSNRLSNSRIGCSHSNRCPRFAEFPEIRSLRSLACDSRSPRCSPYSGAGIG